MRNIVYILIFCNLKPFSLIKFKKRKIVFWTFIYDCVMTDKNRILKNWILMFSHLIYILFSFVNCIVKFKLWNCEYNFWHFFFSYSCGYRKVFEEYVSILSQKYPELQIHGENYKPPGYNMFVAHFLVSNF